jgi:hypothetical protein
MSDTHVRRTREGAPVESANEARQGVTGHNVRSVLFFGLAGIVIAFVIVYLAFFAHYRFSVMAF